MESIDWKKPIRVKSHRSDMNSVRVVGFLDEGERVLLAFTTAAVPNYELTVNYSVKSYGLESNWIENVPKPKKKLIRAIFTGSMGYGFPRYFESEVQMRENARQNGYKILTFKDIEVLENE